MKKLVIAIFVIAGMSVMAQDHTMKGKRDMMKDLTPEQIATLQTKKMTLALDLNDAQQSKLKSMLTEDAKTRKTTMEASKTRREEGVPMTAEEKFAMQNERLDHEIDRKKEMKSLLTAEQYAKWDKMRHQKGMQHKEKRDGTRKKMESQRG